MNDLALRNITEHKICRQSYHDHDPAGQASISDGKKTVSLPRASFLSKYDEYRFEIRRATATDIATISLPCFLRGGGGGGGVGVVLMLMSSVLSNYFAVTSELDWNTLYQVRT